MTYTVTTQRGVCKHHASTREAQVHAIDLSKRYPETTFMIWRGGYPFGRVVSQWQAGSVVIIADWVKYIGGASID